MQQSAPRHSGARSFLCLPTYKAYLLSTLLQVYCQPEGSTGQSKFPAHSRIHAGVCVCGVLPPGSLARIYLLFHPKELCQLFCCEMVLPVTVAEKQHVQVPPQRHHPIEDTELLQGQRATVLICVCFLWRQQTGPPMAFPALYGTPTALPLPTHSGPAHLGHEAYSISSTMGIKRSKQGQER